MFLRIAPDGEVPTDLAARNRRAGDRSPDRPLLGSWSATRWQYSSRTRVDRVVDVVTDLGGAVTLSLSEHAYVLTWDVPERGRHSIGGALQIEEPRLAFRPRGAAEADEAQFHLAGQTLALSGVSGWDFDGEGEEPADFVAVFVRL